ncbi:MAG TPA: hypothetical protein PKN21_08720, partial [Bacteroidales bacterium]|nr:hypothetical protein [Bacteroidales bacterium]
VDPEELILDEFVEVMGLRAKGKKLSNHPVSEITWLDPIPVEEEEEVENENENDAEADNGEEAGMDETENEEITTENTGDELPKPITPVNPPDFPDDDESGMGIQMTLF